MARILMRPAQVDAVLRVYDLAELPSVRSCIFTLLGQMRPTSAGVFTEPMHIHFLTQRFTARDTLALRSAVADLLQLDERVGLTMHNWDYGDPFDLRIPLLNMGLEVTSGRYLIFLDSTDLLCSGALTTLLERLSSTGAAAVLGGIKHQFAHWWGDVFLPLNSELQPPAANCAALLLLDRERLPHKLYFQVAPPGLEIAEFIDRLRKHSNINEDHIENILCIRQIYR